MSERLEITITGRDGVSRTFKAISAEAARTGKSLETAGRQGSRSFDELKRRSTEVGAAIGALAGGIAVLGRSSQNQERQIRGISAAYGDQADEVLALSERIQENTRYSNDAARESALITASLQQNYGLTTDQIEQVIQASADLAAVTGLDLTDSVYRVSGAIRGEGEAAERLGLNMSDAAVAARALDAGMTNWSSPGAISEADKALFRLNILLEQSAYAQGVAGAAAETTAGKTRQYINELQDLGQSAGAALGPVAAVGAEFAPLALALPLVGAGLGKVAGGLTTVAKSAAAAKLASAGLSLALGPAGIAVAAAAAAYGIYEVIKAFDGYDLSAGEIEDSTRDLTAVLAELKQGGAGTTELQAIRLYGEQIMEVGRAAKVAEAELAALGDQYRLEGQRLDEAKADSIEAYDAQYAIVEAIRARMAATNESIISEDQYQQAFKDTQEILTDTAAINYPQLIARMDELRQQYQSDTLSADDYLAALHDLNTGSESFGLTLDDLTGAIDENGEAVEKAARKYSNFVDQVGIVSQKVVTGAHIILEMDKRRRLGLLDIEGDLQKVTEYEAALADEREAAADAAREEYAAQQDLAASYREQLGILPGIVDALSTLSGLRGADAGLITGSVEAIRAAFGGEGLLGTIQGLTRESEQLGTAFDVIVGGTQRLGASSSQLAGFVDDLFGPDGNAFDGVGPLADLLTQGAISQERFNAAAEAGLDIQENNVAIQTDLQAIQAQQLPFLADAQEAYTVYIDQLAQATDAEQRVALALMDQGEAAKVASAFNLAHSASLGELGAKGEDVATQMIAAAVAADPFLKETLTELGLISEGATGEVVVNFPGADQTMQIFQELTKSVDALTLAIGGIPPAHVGMDHSEFDTGAGAVLSVTEALDVATATVGVQSNTDPFWGGVGGIPTYVGTRYISVQPVVSGIGQYGFNPGGYQHGGTIWPDDPPLIPTAQHGRVIQVGEAGPELMTVPPGTSVLPHGASKSKLDSMRRPDSGGVSFHGPVYLYPATTDVEAAIRADLRGRGRL